MASAFSCDRRRHRSCLFFTLLVFGVFRPANKWPARALVGGQAGAVNNSLSACPCTYIDGTLQLRLYDNMPSIQPIRSFFVRISHTQCCSVTVTIIQFSIVRHWRLGMPHARHTYVWALINVWTILLCTFLFFSILDLCYLIPNRGHFFKQKSSLIMWKTSPNYITSHLFNLFF